MSNSLTTIKQRLRTESDEKAKAAFQKFIPTSQRVYGVAVPKLNELTKEYKNGGFELAEALWKSGAFEERLLAAKILAKACKKDPERTIKLIKKFAEDLSDWAVCDTLGTQSVKGIAAGKRSEVFSLANGFVQSSNPWERRLAVVLLTNFVKDKDLRGEIRKILNRVRGDKEHYVKKAFEWLNRDLQK